MAVLLLVGRTGNGKSSTGNTILGRKEFTPRGTSSTVGYDIRKGESVIEDKSVTVVDGPGIGDYTTDITDNGQSMMQLVENALSLTSNMFHALLFVLKYGVRFTKQEQDAVNMIRTIFGEGVLRNHGIIIMTYGDSFDLDMDDDKTTFETWCSQQTGDFQVLLNECQNRCVLFNNISKDVSRKTNQVQNLMKIVTSITTNIHPYTKDDFQNAEQGRKRLLVKDKLPELDSKTEFVLSSIIKKLDRIGKDSDQDHARNIEELKTIFNDLQKHIDFLESEDEGTKSVDQILTRVSIIKSRIKTMIDFQILKLESAAREPKFPRDNKPNFLQKLFSLLRIWRKPLICIGLTVGVIFMYRRKHVAVSI